MSDSEKLSRRDWFRLRHSKPKPPIEKREAFVGQTAIGLTPVEHPENHDGMDLSELPPMRESILTAEQVNDLFSDIAELAVDVMVMRRSRATSHASASRAESSKSLTIAKRSLLSGELPRVQIRYRWQDSLWIDTVESRPDGYRIIRIAHRH